MAIFPGECASAGSPLGEGGAASLVRLHGCDWLQWAVGLQQQQWHKLFVLKAEVAA